MICAVGLCRTASHGTVLAAEARFELAAAVAGSAVGVGAEASVKPEWWAES
jgi:hypothetical protein